MPLRSGEYEESKHDKRGLFAKTCDFLLSYSGLTATVPSRLPAKIYKMIPHM